MAAEAEKKRPEDRTEQERIAILGRPRLGDLNRAQIRIKESKEFKVSRVAASISPEAHQSKMSKKIPEHGR